LLQSNNTVDFWLLSSVARKAFAAATILGVASCAVPDAVGEAAAGGDADAVVVLAAVAAAAAGLAVAAGLAAAPVVAVGALVVGPVAGAVVAAEVADGAALGTDVAVAAPPVVAPHAARSAALPDRAPRVSRKVRRLIARGRAVRPAVMACGSVGSVTGYLLILRNASG
jgi:hypothetical protein